MSFKTKTEKSLAVFGYCRQGYQHSVPESLIKICLLYFDECIYFVWKGKRLKNLLSLPFGAQSEHTIKITPDISILIAIAPNGKTFEGIFNVGIRSCSMRNNIDYFEICWEQNCYDKSIKNSLNIGNYKGVLKFNQNGSTKDEGGALGLLSQFENAKQLNMEFIIHSLKIKYKNKDKLWYYPSLKSHQLKQESVFKWNVDKEMINRFKNWLNGVPINGPILDNLSVCCMPNGAGLKYLGKFQFFVCCMVFPRDVSAMKAKLIVKTNMDDAEKEYHVHFQEIRDEAKARVGKSAIPCVKNEFVTSNLTEELTIDVKMTIKELYDENDNIISVDKWIEHGVVAS